MQSPEGISYCNPRTINLPHVENQSTTPIHSSQDSNATTASFSKARQAAFASLNCARSITKAEELACPRSQRPPFSRPEPQSYENIRLAFPTTREILVGTEASPETRQLRTPSPASNCNHSVGTCAMPPAISRDSRRKTAWLKSRAQYAHDRKLQRYSTPESCEVLQEPDRNCSNDFGPIRKQSVFVKEEELKCLLEDRAGTPHISELQPDDDINTQLDIEELGMGDVIEVLVVRKEPQNEMIPEICFPRD
ncbi:uncharacterized protein K460DRAFT_363498 [Cucurbitaria berberidis CBS 394.84]|uniref:Uncharacterized protein n=1 Tax=Cucurbitaria berberidis CBS 394.84 TaxID=1168544 RepID=A0A9P4GL27_9PLEO|nr:uncharacterized protein K460DRAFT_363498 [Cucurbitaria berberidis CBS 394.84]KAF1847424.1 hypothetical protein K460DRAFT_363498 [Cucurbitaria berberidis CBS 394.84]